MARGAGKTKTELLKNRNEFIEKACMVYILPKILFWPIVQVAMGVFFTDPERQIFSLYFGESNSNP